MHQVTSQVDCLQAFCLLSRVNYSIHPEIETRLLFIQVSLKPMLLLPFIHSVVSVDRKEKIQFCKLFVKRTAAV